MTQNLFNCERKGTGDARNIIKIVYITVVWVSGFKLRPFLFHGLEAFEKKGVEAINTMIVDTFCISSTT